MKRIAPCLLSLLAVSGLVFAAGPQAKTGSTAALAAPTKLQIEAARKAGKVRVRLDTGKGAILLELDGKAAPLTVANFINLVKSGFYSGLPFHRVEPGFVIQAGDATRAGRPGVAYTVPDERSPLTRIRGAIGMAKTSQPNSANSQFYITMAATPHLDRMGFTSFGHVVEGFEVVQKIAVGDRISRAEAVTARPPVGSRSPWR